MRIRTLLALLACALSASAGLSQSLTQQWSHRFQARGLLDDRIEAIKVDNAGNVFVCGTVGGAANGLDAFAMKRGPLGDTLWIHQYNGPVNADDYAYDLALDPAGNAYITGKSTGTGYFYECFTIKLSPAGAVLWTVRYLPSSNVESVGNAIAVNPSTGDVYVAGYHDPTSGAKDWLVLKYNAAGVQQWADVYNGPFNAEDEARGIAVSPTGEPAACGHVQFSAANGYINTYTRKYTAGGAISWSHAWNNTATTGADRTYGLAFDANGHLFVGGDATTATNREALGLRYDASGTLLWATMLPSTPSEIVSGVTFDNAFNIYLSGAAGQSGFVGKINNNGTAGWRRDWRGPYANGYETLPSVTTDDHGNVYATGRSVIGLFMENFIVAKYRPNGDSVWTHQVSSPYRASMGNAIAYSQGKLYAGGVRTDSSTSNADMHCVILDTAGTPSSSWSYNGPGSPATKGQFTEVDANDNIYCAATVNRTLVYGYDVVVVKYNAAGTPLWERYYTSPGWRNDTLTGMALDPAGNVILSISTDSAMLGNNYRLSLVKLSPAGNFIDTSYYYAIPGNSFAKDMAIRADGSVVLAAQSNLKGGMIVNFNASMNPSWYARIDSTTNSFGRANAVDLFPNGDAVLAGYTDSLFYFKGLIQRFSPTGTKLWTRRIDSVAQSIIDDIKDVAVGPGGTVAFTGASGTNTGYSVRIGMLDGATGNVLWQRLYNPAMVREHGHRIKFTPAGNLAFIAWAWTGFVSRYYVGQYSPTGVQQWTTVYNPVASDRTPLALEVLPDNGVATAGWTINSYSTNYDYVLVGYTPTGTLDYVNTYNSTAAAASTWDELYDLDQDSQGNLVVTGRSSTSFYNEHLYQMVTIKYGSPMAPIAAFQAGSGTICAGDTLSFTDQSSINPTGWSWSFPGGTPSSSTAQHPAIRYATPGTYAVTLITTNANGSDTLTLSNAVTVTLCPPAPALSASATSVCSGASISFSDQSTGFPSAWAWSFPGGTPASSTAQNPTVQYNVPGTYSVTLIASNAAGADTIVLPAHITVTSCLLPPVAALSASQTSACTGDTIQFSDLSTGTPSAWAWSFPGGNPASSTAQNPSVQYSSPGTYAVTLIASNAAGADTIVLPAHITVSACLQPPVAALGASLTAICTGDTIQFSDLSAGSPNAWAWSFPGGNPASSTAQNPSVQYSSPGTYGVTLIATNSAGSDTVTQSAYVTVSACQAPPAANFSSDVNLICAGGFIQFSDLSVGTPTAWAWSFPGGLPSTSTLPNPQVNYQNVGNFDVTLIVSNVAGSDTLMIPGMITAYLCFGVDSGSDAALKVYPNPTAGRFSLASDLPIAWVEVLSLQGQTLAHVPGSGSRMELDLKLPAGMYMLRVHGEEGLLGTHRLLIRE